MATASSPGVYVIGLNECRADMKRALAAYPRKLTAAIRMVGLPIAGRAAAKVPHVTGALAGSIRPGVRGTTGYIRVSAPYAGGAEWGVRGKWAGWVSRYGSPPRFVWPTVEASEPLILEALNLELNEVFTAYGWFH